MPKTPSTRRQAEVAGKAIARNVVAVTNTMINLALAGDTKAAEMVLSRALGKGRLATFALPAITSAADAEIAIGAVLSAVAAGKISADDADKIVSIIKSMGETVHMRLVEERLAALEAATRPREISSYRKVAA
jgi:hypothetical protein